MAGLGWGDAVQFGVASGVIAGLVNQGAALLRDKLERGFRARERNAVQAHDRAVRREQGHDAARATFLLKAEALVKWAEWLTYTVEGGGDGDFFYPHKGAAPLSEQAALENAQALAIGHPTREVRVAAKALYDDLIAQYSEFKPGGDYDPSVALAREWQGKAEEIVELIHTPSAPSESTASA